jgi:8-oxo-dGTP pyrophosphatase MutT (NUDIX family)
VYGRGQFETLPGIACVPRRFAGCPLATPIDRLLGTTYCAQAAATAPSCPNAGDLPSGVNAMKDFEPGKLFVSVIDLFAILLPGALVAFLLRTELGQWLPGFNLERLDSLQTGIIFFFLAYLIGHFVFLIGAWLVDDYVYEPIINAARDRQIERLAVGKKRPTFVARLLAAWLARKPTLHTIRNAQQIKNHYLDALAARGSMNTFQWAKARLAVEAPQALQGVHRFEADSKFFRSLCVVLVPLVFWSLTQSVQLTITLVLLVGLAVWRYFDQRIKSTQQAYWHVIELESRKERGYRGAPNGVDRPSHAGGVVYRHTRAHQRQYLVVQASRNPSEWVLPKGHLEPHESAREAAVREVREETGVWATPEADLRRTGFVADGALITVEWFLMRALSRGLRSPEGRQHTWLSIDDACKKLTYPEAQDLVRTAELALAAEKIPQSSPSALEASAT